MEIQNRAREQMADNQRDYYLREQMKAIQNELGEGEGGDSEIGDYRRKIAEAKLPDEVRVVEGETQSQKEARRIVQRAQHTLRAAAAPSEIDLRGMMTDEAIAVLDRFLDTAMMGKLESVTIIHGKGTGAVRKAVREHLKRSRYIKSFRPGRYGEGEDGVTVAELR